MASSCCRCDAGGAAHASGIHSLTAHARSVQIALLRDYLDAEFRPAPPPGKAKAGKKDDATLLPFGYDLERIIDDFVFICMLVRSHSCVHSCLCPPDTHPRLALGGQRFFATAAHA